MQEVKELKLPMADDNPAGMVMYWLPKSTYRPLKTGVLYAVAW
jgi:hypothetical protein